MDSSSRKPAALGSSQHDASALFPAIEIRLSLRNREREAVIDIHNTWPYFRVRFLVAGGRVHNSSQGGRHGEGIGKADDVRAFAGAWCGPKVVPQVLLHDGGGDGARSLDGRQGGRRRSRTKPRLPVVWFHFQECTCCSESFIRSSHPIVRTSCSTRSRSTTTRRCRRRRATRPKRSAADHEEVPGRVPDAGRGQRAHRGRRRLLLHRRPDGPRHPAGDRRRTPRPSSPGAAAPPTAASRPRSPIRPAPRRSTSSISGKPIINVPGCPPIAEVMAGVLTYILRLRPHSRARRPRPAEGVLLAARARHLLPPRRTTTPGLFVETWDDEGARKGYCLYKMGCRGPDDLQLLRAPAWNNGVSCPIQSGHGCIGCSEANFWDNGPFYQRLSAFPGSASSRRPTRSAWSTAVDRGVGVAAHAVVHGRAQAQARASAEDRQGRREPGEEGEPWPTASRRRPRHPHRRPPAHRGDGRGSGVIDDAIHSGTMVRGFELILKGRDPRDAWAFTERACGVCTTVHALASVRSRGGRARHHGAAERRAHPQHDVLRQYLQDHVVHFYHLHALDWVDIVSALKADPEGDLELAQRSRRLAEELAPATSPTCQRAQDVRRDRPARHLRRTPTGATRPTSCRRK